MTGEFGAGTHRSRNADHGPARQGAPVGGYLPALDGLRALSIAAVLCAHAGVPQVGGNLGVTVFFVISGYLITGILIAEYDAHAALDFRRFFRRRFARLAPGLFLVTAATVTWMVCFTRESPLLGALGALTYTTDFLLPALGPDRVTQYFEWSWSLAIEEQFYLIWPIVLLWALRRLASERIVLAIGLAVAAALCWRGLVVAFGEPSHERLYYAFDMHVDPLLLGALLAVIQSRYPTLLVRWSAKLRLGAVGAIALIILFLVPGAARAVSLGLDAGAFGCTAVASTLVVARLATGVPGWGVTFLSTRLLTYVGRLSYSLYLWNMLGRLMYDRFVDEPPAASWWGILWIGTVFAVAALSYHAVESPLRRRIVGSR